VRAEASGEMVTSLQKHILAKPGNALKHKQPHPNPPLHAGEGAITASIKNTLT
jgi:hypothetical protein